MAQRIMSIVSNKPVSSPVLIGRQVEVASLHALIDQARKGEGQVVLRSVQGAVQQRIDQLSEAARHVLTLAAVA